MAMAAELGSAAVSGVASKVSESVFDSVGREISYVFKYRSYVEGLKKQVEDLTNAKERVEHSVDYARRQGEEIEKDVEQWLIKVNDFIERDGKSIIDDEEKAKRWCLKGLCPNVFNHYLLSKEAVKAGKDAVNLLDSSKQFGKVSYRCPPQRTESMYLKDFESFNSRKSKLDDIMEALKDANVNMIGVYGMGGVGKTTLVKKVAWQVTEEKLFDMVVMVDVTQNPDHQIIKEKIAYDLGLELGQLSEFERVGRIRNRLKKEKRVLVILDNIWEKLDLEAIGIPFGDVERGIAPQREDWKGRHDDYEGQRKILLTSRNRDVLGNAMNVQVNFSIETLLHEEAMNLFGKIVGSSVQNSDFQPIAVEIVRKCKGLPLAIKIIANALKSKSHSIWKDTLEQLKKSNPRCIPDIDKTLYSTIELSYNFLESEEAKSLFLLCALLNAGSNIYISFLLTHAMGLGLFKDVNTWEGGRNRIQTLIDNLKASCLLLDGDTGQTFKMHDMVNLVAISIAKREKLMFKDKNFTGLKEVLEEEIPKDSEAISLLYININELPERLGFSKLKLFMLLMMEGSPPLQIPNLFFEGMEELKVLTLYGIQFLSLASSLGCLTNLRALRLGNCLLGDITIIGELKKLETLSIYSSDIEQLPEEIGQLTRLRVLHLRNCSKLKLIKPNVISNLSLLEELFLYNCLVQWDVEGGSNASLAELKRLSSLATLFIHVQDAQVIPQDFVFEKLERYYVSIGDTLFGVNIFNYDTSRALKLKLNNIIYLGFGIRELVKGAEVLYLDELNGIKNVLYELDRDGFPHLKHLHVQNGSELLYIIRSMDRGSCNAFSMLESLLLQKLINLEKICRGQLSKESFSKLRIIKVGECDKLKHVFSVSLAENLSQLQEIVVSDCKNIKEIFSKEDEDHVHQTEGNSKIHKFTKMRSLTLQGLPQLISFGFDMKTSLISQKSLATNTGSKEIVAEDNIEDFMALFSEKVLFPRLENLKLFSINIEMIWLDQLPAMSSCGQTLTSLTVEGCDGLKFLFSSTSVGSLVQLKSLWIRNCKSVEGIIIDIERLEGGILEIVFPELFYLELRDLPKLTRFGSGNSVEFPSLNELWVENCPILKTFFANFTHTHRPVTREAEEINLEHCLANMHPLFDEKVVIPTLANLRLSSISSRKIWCHNQLPAVSFCIQNLTSLNINVCHNLTHIFSSSMVKSLVQLNGLCIEDCKGMEEVIVTEEEKISMMRLFPKLQTLELVDLPKLRIFCNFSGDLVELLSLSRLRIENCPTMDTFVSFNSTYGDITVESEALNSEENNQASHVQPLFDEKVGLPKLEEIDIKHVDNLRTIWKDQVNLDSFCKLNYLHVSNCHKLLNIFPPSMSGRLPRLNFLEVRECNSLEEIFALQVLSGGKTHAVAFTQLRELHLSDLPNLKNVWNMDNQQFLSFRNLSSIKVSNCKSLKSLFPVSIARSLLKLEQLEIESCTMEEIVAKEEGLAEAVPRFVFPQLTKLKLRELPRLESFYPGEHISEWPVLKTMEVWQCDKVEIFASEFLSLQETHGEIAHDIPLLQQPLFLADKVAFPCLEVLILRELPELLHIWKGNSQPATVFQNLAILDVSECGKLKTIVASSVSFQNLKTLEVCRCDELINLVTSSTTKSLMKLERMKISDCKMIEEIIAHMGDEANNHIIFSQLKYLGLHCLPSLISFCLRNCTFEFPTLEQVTARECPKMEFFARGDLSTPKLQRLQLAEEDDDEGRWEDNLNTTIQKLFKEMNVTSYKED